MDRPLERKSWPASKILWLTGAGAVLLSLAYMVVDRAGRSTLQVDPSRLTIARVEHGEFREYFPFDGTVEPVTTVYLDIEEGGRVEEIFIDGGHYVHEGDLILRFSNATLQRTSIDTETRLVENLNALRNTQLTLAQNALLLEDSLLDLNHRISEQEKTLDRYERLLANPDGITDLTRETFERVRDELSWLRAKRVLLRERIDREEVLSRQQLLQAEQSIERLTMSLELLNRIVDSLEVRAPIAGFLSSIDARLGENINRGQRIGQVDVLDEYKISVRVDQFYISRVEAGTTGRFRLDGETYEVVVQRIYPEVVNDVFRVDVGFAERVPPDLRRGQRVSVELSFGEPTQTLTVARGGFQQAGGRWVYLLAEDGRSAMRTPSRFGRQNPRFVEVLEGLKAGDHIITSSYDLFNEADELRFSDRLVLDP